MTLLRGSAKEPTFASFMVYGSQTTIIDIGGARLGVTASPVNGSLQLMFDDASSQSGTLQWKSLNVHLATASYDGKNLAALPVLTVMLEHKLKGAQAEGVRLWGLSTS